jgi:hypothetical protein
LTLFSDSIPNGAFMNSIKPGKSAACLLTLACLAIPLQLQAESGAVASSTGPDGSVNTMRSYNPGPGYAYSYSPARPGSTRPYYPAYRQYPYRDSRLVNTAKQRGYGRNDWAGSNRFDHWNDVISDMVSDMFGDASGDFDFDVNIKFKAKGKGKARGTGKANSDASQRYHGNARGDVRNRGHYYGRSNTRGYTGYRNYGYRPYAPYPAYPYAYPYQPRTRSTPR